MEIAATPIQEGQRFAVTIPAGAKSVEVRVTAEEGRASWSLPVVEAAPASQEKPRDLLAEVRGTIVAVDQSIRNLQLSAAREALQSLRLHPRAPAESRYFLSYYRGLLAEKEGDYRTAFSETQEAVDIAERLDLGLYGWMAEQKLALLLRGVGRSHDAARMFESLGRLKQTASGCDQGQILANQAWALLLAREAGETAEDPTPLLETALARYEGCREGTPIKRVNILINLALAHLQEGRPKPAKTFLTQARAIESPLPPPLELWWLDLEARIALRQRRPAEALRLFQDLEALAATTGSPDGRLRAAYGQALSQSALGHGSAVLEILEKAEALLDGQSLQIPLHEGRETFLATRQALVGFHVETLLDQGRNAEALNVARRARARVLRQLERSDRLANLPPAKRARWERLQAEYQEKRAALEDRVKEDWRLPADWKVRERAARTAEGEALKGILDQAFQILARPGEGMGLPPPPRPGELILAYHPLLRGQWVGFAADGETVLAHRFELPENLSRQDELARLLLSPFQVSIRQARRIRVLASGVVQDVDLHALPFDGGILLAGRPVVYGLDAPGASGSSPILRRRALLVSDPRGDLPGTREEARAVRNVLEAGSPRWNVEELKNAEASARAVQSGLNRADLLHYAGHGAFNGLGGWDSSLLLADETRLTPGDLLALDAVPAWVVLAACDSGQSSSETPVESLGLAQAFLLAGTRSVVASTRLADDRKVPAFFADLYRQLDAEPDLALALQRSQLAWRKREPGSDWAGFRLFEP